MSWWWDADIVGGASIFGGMSAEDISIGDSFVDHGAAEPHAPGLVNWMPLSVSTRAPQPKIPPRNGGFVRSKAAPLSPTYESRSQRAPCRHFTLAQESGGEGKDLA